MMEEPPSEADRINSKADYLPQISTIFLFILAILAIGLYLIQPLKWQKLDFNAVIFLVSWTQVLIILALSRQKYCPAWLLAFYFGSLVVEFSTIESWDGHRELETIVHYAITSVTILSIATLLTMPFRPISPASGPIAVAGEIPSNEDRSPEDSLRLWQFLTTSWVWPLLAIGKARQIEKEDIWKLGYDFQCSRVVAAFQEVQGSTLLRRLLRANKVDCLIIVLVGIVGMLCGMYSCSFICYNYFLTMQTYVDLFFSSSSF
jgi:hypothetical protein